MVRFGFIGMVCGDLWFGNIIVVFLRGNCLFLVVIDLNVDILGLCYFFFCLDFREFFIDCCDGMDVFRVLRDGFVCLIFILLVGYFGFDENWGVVIIWNKGIWCGFWCLGLKIFGFEVLFNLKLSWSCEGFGELTIVSLFLF